MRKVYTTTIHYVPQMLRGTRKQIRPFNNSLFIREANDFANIFNDFMDVLEKLKKDEKQFNPKDFVITDRVIYTIQQALGIGLDLFVESNSARKHVGNRFEELIRVFVICC